MRNNSTWVRLQPSPTTWNAESFNVGLTLLAFIGLVLVYFGSSFVYLIYALASHTIDPRHPNQIPAHQQLLVQLVTYLPVGIYLGAVLPGLARRSLRELGFRMPTLRDVGTAMVGAAGMIVAVDFAGGIIASLTHRKDTEAAVALLKDLHTMPDKIMFATIAIVLAPMIEELAFRVFLFNAIWRYAPFPVAAAASAALFGIVHSSAPPQLITVAMPLALGGFVLAWVYATTRCYWASVITHASFNALSIVALFFFHVE